MIRGRKSCQASHTQFPLTLAWAVTIHKCQGLTLPEIVVDMSPKKGRFSGGQAYVAFSCVRELCKLHIVNYSREQIGVAEHAEEEMHRMCQDTLVCAFDNIFTLGKSDINILHLNVCNLKRKIVDIACDNLFQMANIVSINETHLSEDDRLDPSMLGLNRDFSVFRYDRDGAGGGVAVFVKQMLIRHGLAYICQLRLLLLKYITPHPSFF